MPADLLNNNQRGITAVEMIIGIALFSVIVVSVFVALNFFYEIRQETLIRSKAVHLATEGIESVRYIRDEGWGGISSLGTGVTYYLDLSSSAIATSTTPEIIDGTFTREFELSPVYRENGSKDVNLAGGGGTTLDTDAVVVEIRVGYGSGTTTLSTILTNID